MRTINSRFLCFTILLSLCSCGKNFPGAHPETTSFYLLPGECLENTELTYSKLERTQQVIYKDEKNNSTNCSSKVRFSFRLSWANLEKTKIPYNIIRVIPSDDVFKKYEKDSDYVKDTFAKIFDDILASGDTYPHLNNISTVLYSGELSLVADQSYAGIPAGEDLSSLIVPSTYVNDDILEGDSWDYHPIISPLNNKEIVDQFLGIPIKYNSLLGQTLGFSIPLGDHKIVEGNVNFELKVPVRVVDYLQWIVDKKINPNAPVPYHDEVLTCKFNNDFRLE